MNHDCEADSNGAREPNVILIVQSIGLGSMGLATIPVILAFLGVWPTWPGIATASAAAFLGITLMRKRQSGCVLLLGIWGLYTLLGVLDALDIGGPFDSYWFGPRYDWILVLLVWVYGIFLFMKNRMHFK